MHRPNMNICDLIGFVILSPFSTNRGIFQMWFTEIFVVIVHLKWSEDV